MTIPGSPPVQFGAWVVEPATAIARISIHGHEHTIDIKEFTEYADALYQIAYVAAQPWANDTVIADLVRILDRAMKLSTELAPAKRHPADTYIPMLPAFLRGR